MNVCQVCGLEPHTSTAKTLSVKCYHCGRWTCPDCQREMMGDYGWPVGVYCTDCVPELEDQLRSAGLGTEFRRPFIEKRDSINRPILRAEFVENPVNQEESLHGTNDSELEASGGIAQAV